MSDLVNLENSKRILVKKVTLHLYQGSFFEDMPMSNEVTMFRKNSSEKKVVLSLFLGGTVTVSIVLICCD